MPGETGSYDLSAIVRWLRQEGPWRQHAKSDDPLLDADVDSPGLERYRLAKAALAELDLQERTGDLLSRDKAKSIIGRWSTLIRRLGERLGKRYGAEAAVAFNETLEECSRVLVYELGGNEPVNDGTVRVNGMGTGASEGTSSPTD